ncbi:putative leader peptide [Streptomyces sp. ODS28]
MVVHGVSALEKTPGTLLVGRLHVDLCRLASAICQPGRRRAPAPR